MDKFFARYFFSSTLIGYGVNFE